MRGIVSQHPPGSIAAILVSTALLTGVIGIPVLARGHGRAPEPAGTSMETAFAMPRSGFVPDADASRMARAPGEVGAIHPLPAPEAALVREIFALQQAGRIDQAIRVTRGLRDETLLAEILADRYLSAAAPDPASLQQWLHRWPDRPDADAIRHLLAGASHGRRAMAAPASGAAPASRLAPDAGPPEEADPVEQAFTRNPLLDRTIQARLAQGDAGARGALRLVAATPHIDPLYAAALRAEIARSLFTTGDDALALSTARAALSQSGGQIGLAGYVAGLAAWRRNQVALAQDFFEQASRAALAAASTRAGAAFWAARTHRRLQDEAGWRAWMQRAAASTHTFYGMLAARMLDPAAQPASAAVDRSAAGNAEPATGVLGEIDVAAVEATAEGHRAFALLQVGQESRAEAALRQLWPHVRDDAALCRSIALVAQEAGMTGLSAQIASSLQHQDDRPGEAAHFPIPRLRPRSGFTVNPALVYALTRLESNFDNKAVSGAGADGLMQIMPVTAKFVLARDGGPSRRPAMDARALHNPAFNLEIGQRYLCYLAAGEGIRGDLIRLLASYNAGPNAVAQWGLGRAASPKSGPDAGETDPLLFMEAIPVSETRDFVHRALTYLWIYAARMDLPAPSLDALSQNEWPSFDDEQRMAGVTPEIVTRAR